MVQLIEETVQVTQLEVHAEVSFGSVEEARIVGKAIETLLGVEKQNRVRLAEFEDRGGVLPVRKPVPLYAPEPSQTLTYGMQETEFRLTALMKNLRAAIPTLPADADLADGVMVLDGKRWGLDYQRLFDNVSAHADKADAKEPFTAAVALTLQQEVLRGVK